MKSMKFMKVLLQFLHIIFMVKNVVLSYKLSESFMFYGKARAMFPWNSNICRVRQGLEVTPDRLPPDHYSSLEKDSAGLSG